MTGHPYGGSGTPEDPMDDQRWRRFVLGCLLGALAVIVASVAALAWRAT